MISVIVPVYNQEQFVNRCITAILNQTYADLELILVNDGSTDKSGEICREYSLKDDRIRLIEQENAGVSRARNAGLDCAIGDYIAFVDADDYIDRDTYRKCIDIIENNDVDLVKFTYVKESGLYKKKYTYTIEQNVRIEKEEYPEKIIPFIFSTYDTSCVFDCLIKRDKIKTTRFSGNIKYGEDFEFMTKILLKSNAVFFIGDPFYHYTINENSATRLAQIDKLSKKRQDTIMVINHLWNDLEDKEENRQAAEKRITKSYKNSIAKMSLTLNYKDYKKTIVQLNRMQCADTGLNGMQCADMGMLTYIKYKILGLAKKIALTFLRWMG